MSSDSPKQPDKLTGKRARDENDDNEKEQKPQDKDDNNDIGDEEDKDCHKRLKKAIKSISDELLCPITRHLPFDPVMAEDGRIYERDAIEEHIRKAAQEEKGDLKSPCTNEKMGTKLFSATQVHATIEHLVKSQAIDKNLIDAWFISWMTQAEQKKVVERQKGKARKGDPKAMFALGQCYSTGKRGVVKKSRETACKWWQRAADKGHATAMACFACCLLSGDGVPKNEQQGMHLMTLAAERGSAHACKSLGLWYFDGSFGLPKDRVKALYWLKKASESGCAYLDLNGSGMQKAKELLHQVKTGRG